MRSAQHGKNTLAVEVTNISSHGFWRLLDGEEKFVAFEFFPWFREASIKQLLHVELLSAHHLYWPELDIDLAVESLDYPEKYPLVNKSTSFKTQGTASGGT